MEKRSKDKEDFFPQIVPLPPSIFLCVCHPFQILSSIFIPLPLAKCFEALCLFELSLKQGVRDSTADKQQRVSPAELCCHCQQKRKTSQAQNWAKHLRMYKRAFLFHLSAFCFTCSREGAVGTGQMQHLLLLPEKGWQLWWLPGQELQLEVFSSCSCDCVRQSCLVCVWQMDSLPVPKDTLP